MADARARGMDVLTDQYPYTAFMTGLGVILLPKWANDGGQDDTLARLRDPRNRAPESWPRSSAESRIGTRCRSALPATGATRRGLTLAELAKKKAKRPSMPPWTLLSPKKKAGSAAVHFAMSEEDVESRAPRPAHHDWLRWRRQRPRVPAGGRQDAPDAPTAHSRACLARYVRDREVLTLADAVRRMTSFPPRVCASPTGARCAWGTKPDITVFDPAILCRTRRHLTIRTVLATGIVHVLRQRARLRCKTARKPWRSPGASCAALNCPL